MSFADPPAAIRDDQVPALPPRKPHDHKGTFGTVLLIGGSRGMSGAVALAGMAALRGGAGLVRLAVPDAVQDVVASFAPPYTTIPLPSDRKGRIALDARAAISVAARQATVVGLGPGLGRSPGLDALVCSLYQTLPNVMVVDADALNALAARPTALWAPGGPRILTPHPGEFARLVGRAVALDEREAAADDAARRWGVVLVLKGHATVVTDGRRRGINATGNPGMGTGGTGDVLTGLVTALAGQRMVPWDAARLGVHLHGLAGDLAAAQLGQTALTAMDLIDYLPWAIQQSACAS